jgi:DNA-binding transcriptional LysR family regulator
MGKLVKAFPNLKIDLQDYSPANVPFPRVDVDIIFTVSPPNDSSRMIRSFPGSIRGLFASEEYLREYGLPKAPPELVNHRCVGISRWELTNNKTTMVPPVAFHITTGDPVVSRQLLIIWLLQQSTRCCAKTESAPLELAVCLSNQIIRRQLALDGVGIVVLPLWMAKAPTLRKVLVHVLPGWSPSPIPLWALYCSPDALTPKVKKVLDFLNEYIGTDKDPRLERTKASECFISSRLQA